MSKWNMIVDVEKCENCANCFLVTKDEHVGNDFPGMLPRSRCMAIGGSIYTATSEDSTRSLKLISCRSCATTATTHPV